MKYTEENIKIIEDSIKGLSGRVKAAKAAGISYETFTQWMKKPEFSERIKRAETEANKTGEEKAILSIFEAMEDGKWQAAAWWLERTIKEKYALRQELTGNKGEKLEISVNFKKPNSE